MVVTTSRAVLATERRASRPRVREWHAREGGARSETVVGDDVRQGALILVDVAPRPVAWWRCAVVFVPGATNVHSQFEVPLTAEATKRRSLVPFVLLPNAWAEGGRGWLRERWRRWWQRWLCRWRW